MHSDTFVRTIFHRDRGSKCCIVFKKRQPLVTNACLLSKLPNNYK